MSKTADKGTEQTSKKKNLLVLIPLIVLIALGGGVGVTWFLLKDANQAVTGEKRKPGMPTTFTDLDVFTVNLQPEDGNHYLQVGLTIKTLQTKVGEAIKKQMPEIRNRVLLLLSSKKPSEISTVDGKQKLSEEITHEIRESLDSKSMQDEILGVLFTSFVIQ
jgi:flagellar protein FliL